MIYAVTLIYKETHVRGGQFRIGVRACDYLPSSRPTEIKGALWQRC